MKNKILCFVPTKNRYFTTLPLTLQSVIFQDKKPDKIMVYDDNDKPIDIHKQTQYMYLFKQMEMFGIEYEVVLGNDKGRGQLRGEQYANCYGYKYVWRIDDDQIQSRDILERYWNLLTENVGAVGGCILNPDQPPDPNDFYSSKIKDCLKSSTIQWLDGNNIIEVELLHSSFLYRAGIVDYCLDLIHPNHEPPEMEFRGENIFSHELYRKGYKLLVDQNAKLYHYPHKQWRNDTTCTEDKKIIEEMEYHHNVFIGKLREWGFTIVRDRKNPMWYQSYPRDQYILEDIDFNQYTKNELIQLIKDLYNEGDIEACVERCKQILDVHFDSFLYKVLGLCYYELGDYDKGLECLNKYIEYDSDWIVLNYKGLIYLERNEFDLSLKMFYTSLEIDNNIPDTYHNIGLVFKIQNKNEQAKEYFNKSLELDNNFVESEQMLKELN